MSKKDARALFYKSSNKGDFGTILAGLNKYNMSQSTRKQEIIFHKEQLDNILKKSTGMCFKFAHEIW